MDVSYNAGATWSGVDWDSNAVSSTDIPWLTAANEASQWTIFGYRRRGIQSAGAKSDSLPLRHRRLECERPDIEPERRLPGTTRARHRTTGRQRNHCAAGRRSGVASWDRPFFYISNLNAYPSTYGPVDSVNIDAGWSLDYASSDPSFIVGLADWWGTEESGYSTNGGQTWTTFCQHSHIPGPYAQWRYDRRQHAGKHHLGARRTAFNPIIPSTAAQTWNPITLPGVSSWSSFEGSYYLDERSVTADRVLPIRSIWFIPVRASSKPPTAGSAGPKSIAAISRRSIGTIMN